jgi:hypothetical protein
VFPVDLWWLHSCATNTLHTRLRVQRAPGIPHALKGAKDFMHDSGASRRGIAEPRLIKMSGPSSTATGSAHRAAR